MKTTADLAPRTSGERGSAYMAVLLVLLLLTIMGLSLATVTTLEMEIGSSERAITRTFYAANSGLQTALARVMTRRDYNGQNARMFSGVNMPDNTALTSARGFQIAVSPLVPIGYGPCNLCPVNLNARGLGSEYFRVNHAVTSTATELTWAGDDPEIPEDAQTQAQKTLSVMFEMQPFELGSFSIDLSDEEMQQVKF